MSFCICLLNFIQIGPSVTDLYPFFKMATRASQFYFRFRFRDFAHLRRSKSTCVPNFDEISQSTAEILLRPVSKNKRPSFGILLLVPIFTVGLPRACHFVSVYQISSKSDNPRQIYDVIFIFSRWRPSALLNHFKVTADHPRSANGGTRSVLKFRLDQTYSFGDNTIFVLRAFGLNLPIYMVVSAAHAQNEGLIYFRGRNRISTGLRKFRLKTGFNTGASSVNTP